MEVPISPLPSKLLTEPASALASNVSSASRTLPLPSSRDSAVAEFRERKRGGQACPAPRSQENCPLGSLIHHRMAEHAANGSEREGAGCCRFWREGLVAGPLQRVPVKTVTMASI